MDLAHGSIRHSIRGIIPPMVTPLASADELDHAGLERLIEGMIHGGVDALFILGTTGEGPALSYALRVRMIESVCRQVGGRVPVLVGISDTSYTQLLYVADEAAKAGAAAVVAAPPYYFPLHQSDVLRLIEGWARDISLPVYLYNFPALTKVWFEPDVVACAMDMPHIHGLKDSSGDMQYVRKILELRGERRDFRVLVGPENLLAEALLLGADGGVPGGANLFPSLFTKLYMAFHRGDVEGMNQLQAEVVRLGNPIFNSGEADSNHVARLKCALACRGLCSDLPTRPFRPPTAREVEEIRLHLQASGLVDASTVYGGR